MSTRQLERIRRVLFGNIKRLHCRESVTLAMTLILFFSGTTLFATADTTADDPLGIRLLDQAWETGQANRKQVNQWIAQLEDSKTTADEAYAIGLSLIQHGEYMDAIEWLGLASLMDESNLNARRANVWLFARTKQHNRSLEELSVLLDSMNELKDSVSDGERTELVRFAGRMMGFYTGPANDSIKASTLDRYSRLVLEALNDTDLEEFNEARKEVTGDFGDLADQKETAKDEALKRGIEEQERLKAELEKRKVDLAEEREALSKAYQSTNDEMNETLRGIRERDNPLATRLTRLEQRAISLNSELSFIHRDITRLRLLAAREEDPYLRDRWLLEADRLIITASRVDADLIATRREIGLVAAQRREVLRELNRAEASFRNALGNLESRIEANAKMQTRTDAELTRVLKGPKVESSRTRALGAQANAITTYEEFPLESERRRMLDKFRKDL